MIGGMLPVVLVGPLLLLWLPMARTRRVRLIVAVALAAVIAVAVLLAELRPDGPAAITLAAVLVAALLVAVASVVEQRRLGPQVQPPRIWWLRTVFAVVLLTVLCTYGAVVRPIHG